MGIILPEDNKEEMPEGMEELKYQATDDDEENFILMYHMNMQPSEAKALDPDYKKWLIARFMTQKHMEREAMTQMRMMQAVGPNLHV
jgi:hypothetical protein